MVSYLVTFLCGAVFAAVVIVIILRHIMNGSRDAYEADYD